jgi:hypothetical protein
MIMANQTPEQAQADISPVMASFIAHLAAFRESLPAEEQQVLDQLCALAAEAAGGDTSGYIFSSLVPQIGQPGYMGRTRPKHTPIQYTPAVTSPSVPIG